MQVTFDLTHRLLGADQQAQYRAAVRLRNDLEYRLHPFNILGGVCTCNSIFRRPRQDLMKISGPDAQLLVGSLSQVAASFAANASIVCRASAHGSREGEPAGN